MSKTAVYGIEYLKLSPALESGETAGTFPDFEKVAAKFLVKAIVKDSMSFNDQAPGDTDIEVEDMNTLYASLPSDAGSEGFTVQTTTWARKPTNILWDIRRTESGMKKLPGSLSLIKAWS